MEEAVSSRKNSLDGNDSLEFKLAYLLLDYAYTCEEVRQLFYGHKVFLRVFPPFLANPLCVHYLLFDEFITSIVSRKKLFPLV